MTIESIGNLRIRAGKMKNLNERHQEVYHDYKHFTSLLQC